MLMNTGDKPVYSKNNLLTTVAWKINGKNNTLEGSVFVGATACNGCDRAKMIDSAENRNLSSKGTR
jgi:glycerol kinase